MLKRTLGKSGLEVSALGMGCWAIGGAEVEMSMLFADVRGSTALSEGMSPIEFQKLINRFYIGVTKVIAEEDAWWKNSPGTPSRHFGVQALPERTS
jgi:class 3 adenylate cyclase